MNVGDQQPFISSDETKALATLMERKYASFIGQRTFEAGISRDARGVYAKVVLRTPDGSFYYPVEGRMLHDDHDMTHRAAGLMLLDYIDAYFDEYLKEGGDVYLPIDWADYDADGVALQLRGQILNLLVEKMADELLRNADTTGL
jgi:hypothetical protein